MTLLPATEQITFKSPLLSTSTAHALAFGVAFLYVGSIYVLKNTRQRRDDKDVMILRMCAVSIATALSCAGVYYIVWSGFGFRVDAMSRHKTQIATRERLGLVYGYNIFSDPRQILPHLIMPVHFFGPLLGMLLRRELPFQSGYNFKEQLRLKVFSIVALRNYWIAPATEELAFRACVLAIYQLSGAGKWKMVFLSPLTFGLAHVHHGWESYKRYGSTPAAAKRAIISTLIQLAYTTIFGFHVAYLFLATGSLFSCITCHIFCNIMGLPTIVEDLRRFPRLRILIIGSHVLGIIFYIYTLRNWAIPAVDRNVYWKYDNASRY